MKIATLAAIGALLATSGARPGAPQTPAKPGQEWTVAQRVDDHRIVVLFGGGQLWVPQRTLEASPVIATTRTRTPGRLFDVPADRAQEIVGGAARVGDRWVVDAGRRGRFHVTVEQLVLGYKNCGEAWGVLARVAPDEAARFAAVTEKYYVARLDRAEEPAPGVTTLGPIAFQLDGAKRTELTAILEGERQRTFADFRHDVEYRYQQAEKQGLKWPSRWRSLDARLDRGEGVLTLDTQAFRLTADGEPRLFVRARWSATGYVAYALSVWVRVSNTLVVEDTNAWFAQMMRGSMFQQAPRDNNGYLGLVLNVLDTDGDGRAELLFTVEGYESRNIELIAYPPTTGPRKIVLTRYEDGC